jgi:hypothetical protein
MASVLPRCPHSLFILLSVRTNLPTRSPVTGWRRIDATLCGTPARLPVCFAARLPFPTRKRKPQRFPTSDTPKLRRCHQQALPDRLASSRPLSLAARLPHSLQQYTALAHGRGTGGNTSHPGAGSTSPRSGIAPWNTLAEGSLLAVTAATGQRIPAFSRRGRTSSRK